MLRSRQVIKGHLSAAEVMFAVLAVALPGCGVSVDPDPRQSNEPQAPWRLGYHDGSGNVYRVWRSSGTDEPRFEYAPVRPESSSSGIVMVRRERSMTRESVAPSLADSDDADDGSAVAGGLSAV